MSALLVLFRLMGTKSAAYNASRASSTRDELRSLSSSPTFLNGLLATIEFANAIVMCGKVAISFADAELASRMSAASADHANSVSRAVERSVLYLNDCITICLKGSRTSMGNRHTSDAKRKRSIEMEQTVERIGRMTKSSVFVWVILALPLLWLIYAWQTEVLFYGEVIHISGEFSARLLILTMAITPFRLMFPDAAWPRWLLRRRRYIGVAVFAYALLHTLVYLDRKRTLDLILEEGAAFSMWTGWLAFGIFLILAVTSNDRIVQVLRQSWKNLHRGVYWAAALTFIHWIFVAFDFVPGLVHLLVLLSFELIRVWKKTNAT
jgi:sulfoxide reductase heme-binding subunit YedZ